MRFVKPLIAACLVISAAVQLAGAKDVVLQNGSNEYSGCVDSWILQGAIETIVMDAYMPERFDVYCDTCLA